MHASVVVVMVLLVWIQKRLAMCRSSAALFVRLGITPIDDTMVQAPFSFLG
jgi:hypothetical protein